MQKPAPPTANTLSLDQLRERFPRTAERFRASKYWSPLKEENIARELEQFFDVERNYVIHLEGVTEHGKVIGYWPKLTVHYKPAYFGKDWFQDKEDARLFILDLAASSSRKSCASRNSELLRPRIQDPRQRDRSSLARA